MFIGNNSVISKYFEITNGELYIGKYSVTGLATKYGTPLYVYDGEIMKRKYEVVKRCLPNFDIFYSVKANPNISICSLFKSLGAGAEVASGGELFRALKAQYPADNIIFVGPGKTEEEIRYAIKNNIYAIVAESINELRKIDILGRDLGKNINVMIRVNIEKWTGSSPEIMAGGPSKFGIDEEKVVDAINKLNLYNTQIIGIYVYTASQVLDLVSIIQTNQRILELACYYSEKLNFRLQCIDFGGGWGVPYEEGKQDLDISILGSRMQQMVKERFLNFSTRFIFELGRYLVAEAGVYLTKVIDIKESRGKKYLITDGGINQQIRPFFMNLNHPTLIVNKLDKEKEEIVQIGGPLCTPFDMLARDVYLPKAEVGDIIGIFNSGAYGFTMSMLNFLSHPWPAEVLVTDNNIFLIRKRGTYEDLQGEEVMVRF